MDARELLVEYENLQAHSDALALRMEAETNAVLTDEQRAEIAAIKADYAISFTGLKAELDMLYEAIKRAVIAEGAPVDGERLRAVYVKPRITWDSKKLEGLAMVIPQVLDARKEGEASIQIRNLK